MIVFNLVFIVSVLFLVTHKYLEGELCLRSVGGCCTHLPPNFEKKEYSAPVTESRREV